MGISLVRLLVGLLVAIVASANVIGLDFGSDSMKVAIVQPGTPLEIVTNFQSKRKTPTSISFYRDERLFGSDSIALQPRKPEVTYSKMYRALGRVSDHPHVDELVKSHYFPHKIYHNETSGRTHVALEESQFSPEELIAMLMQHAKDMTANYGGKLIKDCVVTVPSFFTQHERRALYTAANIADLNILSLVEENTAAALHFAIDRIFEEPTTVMFYNLGSGSLQVTLVTYSSHVVKEFGKNKTVGQFEVVGKAWDSHIGGFNFDLQLIELLADRFNEVWAKKKLTKAEAAMPVPPVRDIRQFNRAMTRLRGEANKVKEVLSANQEYPVKIEQLHADVDLVTKVTRAQFEEASAALFARLTAPIDRALAMANLSLSDVSSVELLGGGVRVPRVKKVLEEYFKNYAASAGSTALELGQHLNGDEAMALGAAFRAANLSTAFRVRKVGMTDVASFSISVQMETLPAEPEAAGSTGFFGSLFGKKDEVAAKVDNTATENANPEVSWSKQAELFSVRSNVPSKTKTVTFPYDKDINCRLFYTDATALPEGTNALLAVYNITGISTFAKEIETNTSSLTAATGVAVVPKVHLSFALGDDGLATLLRAEVSAELPQAPAPTVDPSVNSTAGDESVTATSSTADFDNETIATSNSTDSSNATAADDKKKKVEAKKADKKKDKDIVRRALHVAEDRDAVSPSAWSPVAISEARQRLTALKLADDKRKEREAALNDLETYIYKVKNQFADEEVALSKVSTAAQREEVVAAASAAEEWLYEDGSNSNAANTKETYLNKKSDIKKLAEAVLYRFTELTERPAAVQKAQDALADVTAKVAVWMNDRKGFAHITEKELEQLSSAVTKMEEWLEEKQEAQLAASPFESPVFASNDVGSQLKTVGVIYEKLVKRPKPAPKVVSVSTNSTVNETAPDSNSTTASATEGEDETIKVQTTGNSTESASTKETDIPDEL